MEIKVIKDILSANDRIAAENQRLLDGHQVFAVNLMSSPGSGKTSLILQTIGRLKDRVRIGVIEGDIASRVDADRIGEEKVPVLQINTGGACHLDANMLGQALKGLPLADIDLLLVENVGNLICPAELNLGERRKAMILSLPEGDDKPLKYPLMFTEADVVLINKMDLLPLLDFDIDAFRRTVAGLNQKARVFPLSCKTGEGIDEWVSWLLSEMNAR